MSQLCKNCQELVPEGCCTCGPDQELVSTDADKYAPLIGLTYPDGEGRTITILDVDEWGTCLMERGGTHWGCKAEYLMDLLPAPAATTETKFTLPEILEHTLAWFDALQDYGDDILDAMVDTQPDGFGLKYIRAASEEASRVQPAR